ncbi:chromosome condensation regulator RCC1 [Psychrobacter sp. Cmf 22.2]|uniref:RCC1 domain-containing protein n=2 Tax=unclassified Psychrobacter TaxID=196806 RepID=UPI0009469681|nr:chromosome condensation regulator RCC1 [Psychrobacter sp. Cmf 22.2]OLF39571.1 chromosome condensation regulator RCC1 [Psychrobacter sp. Cmf 22.2]
MRLSHLAQTLAVMTTVLALTACGDDKKVTTPIIDGTPPLLTTDSSFSDGYSAVAAVSVSGQVQDNNGIKSFTYQLNEEPVHTLKVDAEGYFSETVFLMLGRNKITLEATDNANNTMRSTKTIYLGDTIAAGGSHTAALRDGQLYSWGRNNYGQTGLGLTTKITDLMGHPDTPMLINNAPQNLVSVSFNQNHSLSIDQNGQVYSWGEDKYGQLGRGTTGRNSCSKVEDCRLDIGAVQGIEDAVMVAAGYKHNLVLTKDGNVWAFGANGEGQLGNGPAASTNGSSIPVKVDFSAATDIGHIVQVVASANSSYALDDKGQVWGWGSDAYANLGKGKACTNANECVNINATPVFINIIENAQSDVTQIADASIAKEVEKVTQLAAGRDHVLALTNRESVYGWGLNATSQIGYNGEIFSDTEKAWDDIIATPTKLPWFADKDVRRIYANGNASYALLDNGQVYPWGMFGETNGAGKTIYNDLDEPTDKLPNLQNIDNMAMGAMHLIAHEKLLNQDNSSSLQHGSLFTWGWSFEGSLGNKDTTHVWMYNTPIPVSLPSQL